MPRTSKNIQKPKKIFYVSKSKKCIFTEQNIDYIDYKDSEILKRFVSSSTGKILPRRVTGTSARYQRKLAKAIKQSREAALLPFVKD